MPMCRDLVEKFQKEFENIEPLRIDRWVRRYFVRYKQDEDRIRRQIVRKIKKKILQMTKMIPLVPAVLLIPSFPQHRVIVTKSHNNQKNTNHQVQMFKKK